MTHVVVDNALLEVVNDIALEVVSVGADVVEAVLVVEVPGPGRQRTLVRSPTPGREKVGRARVGLQRTVRREGNCNLWLRTHRIPRAPNTFVENISQHHRMRELTDGTEYSQSSSSPARGSTAERTT